MINKIKNEINSMIGIDFNTINCDDISVFLEKMCKDMILMLNDDNDIKVIINNSGDIEITHGEKFYKVVIKDHNNDEVYSVPNLISIKRAKDFLSNHNNNIIYVFIEHNIKNYHTKISDIKVQKIESLDWSYLAIQNLGRGQLQVKNTSTELMFNDDISRDAWLKELKEKAMEYYDKLILKVVTYKSEWEDSE